MAKKDKESFIAVYDWIVTDYKLKSNTLLIFSIIFNFTKNDGWFEGSLNYLANRINVTKQTVINSLNELIEMNLIEKKVHYIHGVKAFKYRSKIFNTQSKNLTEVVKKFDGGGQKIRPNNKIYKKDYKKDLKKERKDFDSLPKTEFDKIVDSFKNVQLQNALKLFIKMRFISKKPLTTETFKLIIDQLRNMTSNEEEQLQIVNNSVMNGWNVFYPLKKEDKAVFVPKKDEDVIAEEKTITLEEILELQKNWGNE